MSQILLLEDDEALGRGICMALETSSCTVTHCSTRCQATGILQSTAFDLLIFDINLPDGSGLELLRTLRQNGSFTPAILLTANDLELDEVTGLEAGADDYITKPFSPKELVLRVNNIMKRTYKSENTRITIDSYELDEEQRKVFDDKVEIDLTTKEFDLLMMFIKNKGIAFSREKILENVWEDNYFGSDRVVDDTLRRLRKKLPKLNIHTIYGYGYRLG